MRELCLTDMLRTGRKRNLFRPDCLISGKEDSGNVFARGYYSLADDMKDLVLDRIRKVVRLPFRASAFPSLLPLAMT